MGQMENRQHPRFPLRMPVLCESPVIPRYHTLGLSRNVSRGGLQLEASQVLTPGTVTNLRLLTGEQIARADAVVVWITRRLPSVMGLRFTALSDADRLAWEQLMAFQSGPTSRAFLRVPIDLEVTCLVPPDTRLRGRGEDLSDGGMMIVLPQAVAPRTRLCVVVPPWLFLPPVEAEVVWTRAVLAGPGAIHGVRFLANDTGKELFLVGTLLRRLLR
ncbi:MAG: PilZ domain-containing protein [Candidatus Methylomirabilales bacterium]